MFTVVTVRFNDETLTKNYFYRQKRNLNCLYCSPYELSPKIDLDSPVFVIEMNNSTNKITGIGLIKNKIVTDKYYKVHDDANTNRFIYIGKYHLDREKIETENPELVYVLDEILFKGKTHSKRGLGLTKLPDNVLKFDICKNIDIKKEIRDLFIHNFRENNDCSNNDSNL